MLKYTMRYRNGNLYARIYLDSKELSLKITGNSDIPKEAFDAKKKVINIQHLPTYFKDVEAFNQNLNRAYLYLLESKKELNRDSLRESFLAVTTPVDKGIQRTPLDNLTGQYLEAKREAGLERRSIASFESLFSVLRDFNEHRMANDKPTLFHPDLFDREMYYDLDTFILQQNIGSEEKPKTRKFSSRNKHMSRLRTFLKWCNAEGAKHINVYNSKEIVVYLDPSEVLRLHRMHLTGWRKHVRDIFVWMCFTGQRFGDAMRTSKADLQGHILDYVQEKTGGQVQLQVSNAALKILMDNGGELHRMTNQAFNRMLKKLLEERRFNRLVKVSETIPVLERSKRNAADSRKKHKQKFETRPLYEVARAHTGRRTFVMTLLNNGVPVQSVMAATGHMDYKSFEAYVTASHQRTEQTASMMNALFDVVQKEQIRFEENGQVSMFTEGQQDELEDYNQKRYVEGSIEDDLNDPLDLGLDFDEDEDIFFE